MDRVQQLSAIAHAARVYGIHATHFSHGAPQGFIPSEMAMDHALAMDALPALVTVSNSGVPAFMTNYIEPKLIEVLTAPNKATEVLNGETKKGDWTTLTAYFSMVESTGETSSYGDYNENGEVNSNVNWPQRQSYHYQTMTQWGDRQLAMMGNAQIDWASQQSIASAKIMRQFENKAYFYGISGLQNYGILNDPGLSAAISPVAKTAGGFTWAVATYLEIIADILKLYQKAVTQSGGILQRDAAMTLALPPEVEVYLSTVQALSSNTSVYDYIKKTYPNMRIVTAVQYATGSGNLVQLIVDELEGQKTGQCAFTEKMRAHGVVRGTSSFREKKSAGTWGAIFYSYVGVAQMLGV